MNEPYIEFNVDDNMKFINEILRHFKKFITFINIQKRVFLK